MHHFRKNYARYKALNAADKTKKFACGLCKNIAPESIVETGKSMRVVKNRIAYDLFDGLPTTGEHLLIIPRRHVTLFEEFTDAEKLEHMDLIAQYEKQGYSVYARSHSNIHRSQPHQHTHLIKVADKQLKFLVVIKKPYLLYFR